MPAQTTPPPPKPLVYLSYSHPDREWAERVLAHFGQYTTAGQFDVWSSADIAPGENWEDALKERPRQASVAVLLISPEYLQSQFIIENEVPTLLERSEVDGLPLLPVLLEPCPWKAHSWLVERQLFPAGARPLSDFDEEEIESQLASLIALVAELAQRERPAERAARTSRASRKASKEKAEPRPEESSVDGETPSPETPVPETPAPPAEPPATPSAAPAPDRVPTHTDDPSKIDLLNRRPFAEVISIRIGELRHPPETEGGEAKRDKGSFAVHLYGPWGAGKTSVLHFIKDELVSGDRGAEWIAVVFNAWQHQRLRPPWWSLIRQVYLQSRKQLVAMAAERPAWEREKASDGKGQRKPTPEEATAHQERRRKLRRTARRLRRRWFEWRLRADLMPALVALVLLALVLLIMRGKVDTGMKVAATLLAAGAGALAFGRSLLFGSAKAAESYLSISRDPMSPIGRLFEKVVDAFSDYPLVVFIDDLDRCDSGYVVELLEGIQTLFRRAPVTWVVLADRKWIRSSFEQVYSGFEGVIAEPGRPLGYLFLEKMFQISAPLPRLSGGTRSEFWDQLLDVSKSGGEEELLEAAAEAEREAEEILAPELDQEQMERVIQEHRDKPLLVKGLRTVAAKRMSSPAQQRQTAHFLQPFAPLLEPNPRAMKRLVNAYGIYQAVNFLEGRQVNAEALALWCILEMRWPLLAECLADTPRLVAEVGKPKAKEGPVPPELADLFASDKVARVVDPKKADGKLPEKDRVNIDAELSAAEIRSIVGSWLESRQLDADAAPPAQ